MEYERIGDEDQVFLNVISTNMVNLGEIVDYCNIALGTKNLKIYTIFEYPLKEKEQKELKDINPMVSNEIVELNLK